MGHDNRRPGRSDPGEVVDDLEADLVRTPQPVREIDPASATEDGTDDVGDERAGTSEPPD